VVGVGLVGAGLVMVVAGLGAEALVKEAVGKQHCLGE
jgi:hypothetical protein